MLMLKAIFTVLLISAPLINGQCNFENNIDFYGNDLTYVFTTDSTSCCNLCTYYPGCQAFTYVTLSQACWLKNSLTPTRLTSPGRVSGLKATAPVTAAPVTAAPVTAAPVTVAPVTAAPVTAAPVTTTVAAVTTTAAPVTTTVAAVTTAVAPVTTTTVAATTTTTAGVTTPTTTVVTTTTNSATTTALVTTTKNYGCFIENNVNYIGNDLSSSYVDSMADCCNLCGSTSGCVVWAYWSTYKFCYLKNQLPSLDQRQDFTNMFSGIITLR